MVELRARSSRLAALEEGAIFVYPTDTAYGLGARIDSERGVRRVFEVKDRSPEKTIPVLGTRSQLEELGCLRDAETRAAGRFWPGGLTLVVPARDPDSHPPGLVREGTLALRVPGYEPLLELLEETGPITGTSANPSGAPAPARREELDPGLERRVDFVLGEHTATGESSTVAQWDADAGRWILHREGPVRREQLESLVEP